MKCKIFMTVDVDEEENILPVDEDNHEHDIQELVEDAFYDIDGFEIKNIKVTKNEK